MLEFSIPEVQIGMSHEGCASQSSLFRFGGICFQLFKSSAVSDMLSLKSRLFFRCSPVAGQYCKSVLSEFHIVAGKLDTKTNFHRVSGVPLIQLHGELHVIKNALT